MSEATMDFTRMKLFKIKYFSSLDFCYIITTIICHNKNELLNYVDFMCPLQNRFSPIKDDVEKDSLIILVEFDCVLPFVIDIEQDYNNIF